MYPKLLDLLRPWSPPHAAHLLGWHAEGPFLQMSKRGAHSPALIISASEGFKTFESIYSPENLADAEDWLMSGDTVHNTVGVRIITAAPEVEGVMEAINEASKRGICFNIGHRYVLVENDDTMLLLYKIAWLQRISQLQQYGMVQDASHISSMPCRSFTIATRLSLVYLELLLIYLLRLLRLFCHSLPLSSVPSMPRCIRFQSPRSLRLITYRKHLMRLRHPLRHPCSLRNKLSGNLSFPQASQRRARALPLSPPFPWGVGSQAKVSSRRI